MPRTVHTMAIEDFYHHTWDLEPPFAHICRLAELQLVLWLRPECIHPTLDGDRLHMCTGTTHHRANKGETSKPELQMQGSARLIEAASHFAQSMQGLGGMSARHMRERHGHFNFCAPHGTRRDLASAWKR